jgi:hypothetical protein
MLSSTICTACFLSIWIIPGGGNEKSDTQPIFLEKEVMPVAGSRPMSRRGMKRELVARQ